ncbi:MAG: excinuclease ABC subunit A [Candidatus Binatia bacterium]
MESPEGGTALSDRISIRGARQHNLRNIDLDIPRDCLVVITGLSGSGKSSLAFDTIYAEGQRRYVESLSAYARQFLEQMEKPDVDSIEGLSPAISIEQKTTNRNPRSTVGTVTEVYDFLRLLYATIGRPHCWQCGSGIAQQSVGQIVDRIMEWPSRTKVDILGPAVRGRKGEYRKELGDFAKQGFLRARVDGEMVDLDSEIRLERNQQHSIDVLVDRLSLRAGIQKRLTDSLEVALKLADQTVTVVAHLPGAKGAEEELTFSKRFACPSCGTSFSEISPRTFSFNSPHGACSDCNGIGRSTAFDPETIVVDPSKAAHDGALGPWNKRLAEKYSWATRAIALDCSVGVDSVWSALPEEARTKILYGSEGRRISGVTKAGKRSVRNHKTFSGVIPILTKRYRESESDWVRTDLEKYMSEKICSTCEGTRLRPEASHVLVGDKPIHEVTSLSLDATREFLSTLKLNARDREVSKLVLKEILERLEFLLDVGLSYLSLNRGSGTLSGGEGQRIRLATQIGAGLSGVLYVLDEPSIGLHQRDNERLLGALRELTNRGNSVLVVEHDADTIAAADHVIDMGPGAAAHGGEVVAAGTPAEIAASPDSLTGRFLCGAERIEVPQNRRSGDGRSLALRGASHNNLKNVDVEIPLGLITCVTGVSGSGKSSLIIDTLYPALASQLHRSTAEIGAVQSIEGIEHVDKVIDIDQSPIGRTPRSNPATYTGLFTDIRDLFAMLPESRMRGYSAGRFSFNVAGGRCEACSGDGMLRIEMQFLPDVYVTCDICEGRRYNRETLDVLYKGKSVADVLGLTVAEALELLGSIPGARRKLETLSSVGLDYIHLGQAANTLSGGEAQRIKLAKELSKRATGRTVFILDEPTTGLHFADVRRLLEVLSRLAEAGNTVIVIEHHLDVIKTADWVIDLGPEGGGGGGELLIAGTPEEVARCSRSHTGRFLAQCLASTAA